MAEQRCGSCGLDYGSITPPDAVAALRSFPRRYRAAFVPQPDDAEGKRPERRPPPSGGWSALAYAAHVRDVLELYRRRIAEALAHDLPTFESVDPDQLAEQSDYDAEQPERVLDQLEANAVSLADAVGAVPDDGWSRAGIRDGEPVDVLWMIRQAVHEGAHHLRDVTRVLAEVRSP